MTTWISRASVLRIIDAEPVYSDVINEKTYMASQIENLPTKEETFRPHGEWIFDSEFPVFGNPYGTYKCSCCGGHSSNKYSFCKDCGADMRKEGEAE